MGQSMGQPGYGAPASAPMSQQGYGAPGGAMGQQGYGARPAQRMGVLIVRQGKEPGRSFEMRKDRTTIGRSRDSDIFLEDLAVSRLHTTIARDEHGRYILHDEGSANGTFVNGQRVSEHILEEGDEVQVGQTILAFARR
jgi:pSer/pThr/pTyr-binding forkhead associated (FHA) protein